jgi:catechol 2,3-dioxygenase-like lactoylglutathione lyase family enzyme
MKIRLTGVPITDLDQALAFYTEVLGFQVKQNKPMGDTRLITLVSPEEPHAAQLMLEPSGEHPATRVYKKALYDEGIPHAAFEVDDIAAEYERLTDLGVEFRGELQRHGTETVATFDDTCGNLIMIYQVLPD